MSAGSRLPGTAVPSRYFDGAGGCRLAADEWGDPGGPLVILQHGGGQTRHAWKGRKALPVSYIKAGMITRHQSMLYRKERVLDERYPSNFKLSGDYALTANLLMKTGIKVSKVNFPICAFSLGGTHDTFRLKALQEDFKIRKTILKENLAFCILLFCVHWLHHHIRVLTPSLNKRFIYTRPGSG